MSTCRQIIAIMGFKRSGKDTLADHIVKGYGYKKMSIAEPLKEACKLLFGFSDDQVNTNEKDVPIEHWDNLTSRQILQFFGTEMMQYKLKELMPNMGRLFWMHNLYNRIENNDNDKIVIADLRFKHEFNYLVEKYGRQNVKCIKVWRDSVTNSIKDMHVSEREWLEIESDYSLTNNSSIDDFTKKYDELIQ